MASIPLLETRRMLDLAVQGIYINRVVRIFHTWLLHGGWVENSRTQEESGLNEELRMDRLERIIREEGFSNFEIRGRGVLEVDNGGLNREERFSNLEIRRGGVVGRVWMLGMARRG